MGWIKLTADKIFDGNGFLADNQVLIATETGEIEAIVPLADAGDDIQHHTGILSPGFVNCHCHLELSHMKGVIPEKTGLVDFVIAVMQQRGFTEDVIYAAIEKAEAEMLQNGIVAVGDICNTAHTLPQKQKGHLHYYNFIEATGFVPAFAQKRFEQAEAVYGQMVNRQSAIVNDEQPSGSFTSHDSQFTAHDSRLTFDVSRFTSIVPHAPYSTSAALMQLINQHSAGKVVTIHNQETPEENSFFLTGESGFRKLFNLFNIDISFFKPTGKTSLQTYLPELDKAGKLILVHDTFTSEEDVKYVKRQSVIRNRETAVATPPLGDGGLTFFCLCPNANLYIENKLPDVDMLRANQCNIVLGTDSLASNHGLCILGEIQTLRYYLPHIPVEQLLQWATLNGARALDMDSVLGSFEKGKRPGVLCISEDLEGVRRLV